MSILCLSSYLYVLYGMGFNTDVNNVKAKYRETAKADLMFENINKASDLLIKELPQQRELVEKVIKYGFNKI